MPARHPGDDNRRAQTLPKESQREIDLIKRELREARMNEAHTLKERRLFFEGDAIARAELEVVELTLLYLAFISHRFLSVARLAHLSGRSGSLLNESARSREAERERRLR